jgi:hypothetical protein
VPNLTLASRKRRVGISGFNSFPNRMCHAKLFFKFKVDHVQVEYILFHACVLSNTYELGFNVINISHSGDDVRLLK